MKKILLFAAMALFTISAAAQSIGRVSVEELITLMPEYMEAQRTIAAVSHETTETFQAMVSEFQSKSNTFEQKKDSWTSSVRETKQAELSDMQRRLQEFQQTAYQELQEKQNELMAPIQEKAMATVRDIAKAQGLALVFDISTLVYYDEAGTVDLMPAARKALNIPDDRTQDTVKAELTELQLKYAE